MATYLFIFAFVFLNGAFLKPVLSQNNDTEDGDILKNLLQEFKAIKKDLNNCKLLEVEVKGMKDELEKIRAKYEIQSNLFSKTRQGKRPNRSKRDLQSCHDHRIAFSAYLDHHVTNLGRNQAIVYNRILLNEGGAYNVYNGMFTVPKSGVYLFSWSCTARKISSSFDIWVSLIVNAATQTTAVAESQFDRDDHQGSSTAIIHVNKGDIVWTKHVSPGVSQIHSSSDKRLSSFTGALLFADDC